MAVSAAAVAKAAAMLLTNEKTRKGLGWILVAIFSPVILLIALLCSLGSGGAEHNNYSVEACFYGAEFSAEVPAEFRYHIEEMRSAFSLLDSAVSSANGQMDSGNSLDPIRVKAVFYALCFGEDAPSTRAANSFVGCFYTTETRTRTVEVTLEDGTTSTEEEEYTVAVPVSLSQAYANLEAHLGREITEDDKSNIDHIYTMIAGSAGGGSYSGEYLRGDGSRIELDISAFTDPTTKNAADLVTYAIHAWESGWGYVWGTYGSVLTDSLFAYKLEQYPDGVGSYADFIRANWLGGRTTDCVGLIKGYGWLNPDTMTIEYGTNGMPDLGANQMYYNASVSGTIDTMPDIPGLAVWHDGHIGVYIGDGYATPSPDFIGRRRADVSGHRLSGRLVPLLYPERDQIQNGRRRPARHRKMGHSQRDPADLCPCPLRGEEMAQRPEPAHGAGAGAGVQGKERRTHRPRGQR